MECDTNFPLWLQVLIWYVMVLWSRMDSILEQWHCAPPFLFFFYQWKCVFSLSIHNSRLKHLLLLQDKGFIWRNHGGCLYCFCHLWFLLLGILSLLIGLAAEHGGSICFTEWILNRCVFKFYCSAHAIYWWDMKLLFFKNVPHSANCLLWPDRFSCVVLTIIFNL